MNRVTSYPKAVLFMPAVACLFLLSAAGCGSEPKPGRTDQVCHAAIAESPDRNVRLFRESHYKVEAKDTADFNHYNCNPWLLNHKFYSPGTHLYLAVEAGDSGFASKIKLMPENFDHGQAEEIDFRIPYTSDRYTANFYQDSTYGHDLGLLKLSLVNQDEPDFQRGSLDEYIWLFKRNPLKQVFFFKITTASVDMVNGKPRISPIREERVFLENGRIKLSSAMLGRTLVHEMAGDTFLLTQTIQHSHSRKADTL